MTDALRTIAAFGAFAGVLLILAGSIVAAIVIVGERRWLNGKDPR